MRDDQWDKIKDLLPAERKPPGGRPPNNHRQMLNANHDDDKGSCAWSVYPSSAPFLNMQYVHRKKER
ncbi:transposase [Paenibacillus sp. S-38]|uniref:transposase n=1 Tax=Paenibacillus sp. S-38 TaxID=3416710 RepID=UPI003CF3A39D